MFVHSCCCIWIFILSGLIQIQKMIQNLLENALKCCEKKKRKEFSLFSAFGPCSPCSLADHRSPASVSPLPAWAEPSERRWPSSRERARLPFPVRRWHPGSTSQGRPFLKSTPPPDLPFQKLPTPNPPPYLPLSLPDVPSGYISHVPRTAASI
jgi:hypothetical protein